MIGADGNHRPKPTRPFGARASRATTYLATLSVFASCLGSLLAFNGRWRGTNVGARRPAPSPYGGTPRRPLSLRSAPFRDADGCDLDAIEEGLSKEERLSRPKRKRAPAGSKRGANGKGGEMASALPTEPTRSGSSKKRKRKRGRRPSSEMPPWLSRYERDDLSGAHHLEGEAPPGPAPFFACEHGGDNEQNALSHIQRLQLALNGIFYHPTASDATTTAGAAPTAIPYFSLQEIDEVMDSVRVASDGNLNLMSGCADFLYLMLTLEEEGMLTSDFAGSDLGGAPLGDARSIMTRDVLVAAAFHYCDCVRARKAGLYDHARRAMVAPRDMSPWLEEKKHLWLPPSTENVASDDEYSIGRERPATNSKIAPSMVSGKGRTTIERYGEESVQIATGAARLKRAEVMSAIVNSKTSQSALGNTSQRNGDADILRSFLVSLSEDWRALVIRSAACLYRLKGIVDDQGYGRPIVLSTSTMGTAREAFRVYAPLAQRLGMQRLKSELENTAFRLLYPRQYAVASTLYSGDIDAMKSIVEVLSSRIEQLLRSDPVFLDQLDDVTVSSRVKEPYSLWRKLLRYRKEMANEKRNDSGGTDKFDTGKKKFDASTLSLKLGVPDAIALRVVLSARRMSPLEDDDSLRTREKMMCYYALQLISDVWPTSAFNEAKDYIKNPKPNGYQSLHYTASLVINGEEWPFEVQIRSEEMHSIAEFGVAAHWEYKLDNKEVDSLPEKSSIDVGAAMPALPPARNSTSMLSPKLLPMAVVSNITVATNASSRAVQKGRIASYIEALTTSREHIVQSNMFVFLSSTENALDGIIVSIDPSAFTVADVLRNHATNLGEDILDDVSDGTLDIYQNGVATSLDGELSNGDVLTLPKHLINKLNF